MVTEGERKPTATGRGDHECSSPGRGVGLGMAPSTKHHRLVEVEIGATLGLLDQVVHVAAAAASSLPRWATFDTDIFSTPGARSRGVLPPTIQRHHVAGRPLVG